MASTKVVPIQLELSPPLKSQFRRALRRRAHYELRDQLDAIRHLA